MKSEVRNVIMEKKERTPQERILRTKRSTLLRRHSHLVEMLTMLCDRGLVPPLPVEDAAIVAKDTQYFGTARLHAPQAFDRLGDGHPVQAPHVVEIKYHPDQPG
jgi:hypothetical protein